MTEKNADVEWLRATFGGYLPPEFNAFATREVYFMQMRRLLAHIDELEKAKAGLVTIVKCKEEKIAELEQAAIGRRSSVMPMWTETVSYEPSRPTVHEIAAQMMAAMRLASYLSHKQAPTDSETIASWSYADAEALVAEGRRRDAR